MERKVIRPSKEWYIEWERKAKELRWDYLERSAATKKAIQNIIINV